MSQFNLIYIPQKTHLIYDEYYCNLCETKYSDKTSHVFLWGEQPNPNVYEGDFMFILLFGIPSLMIVFVFMQPLPDVHINLSHVS